MAKKRLNFNFDKLVFQWLIVLLLVYMVVRLWLDSSYSPDFEAYCPFGGMLALSSYLESNTLACSMTSMQIAFGVILLAGVLLFSKLFCGYLCPVGIFTEWLGKLGERIKFRLTITGLADRLLRVLKYGLLFITFYFTIKSSELFCKQYDPYYAIFSWFSSDVNMVFAIISISIMLLGAIFLRQFWCKYLCPLSAISNIFSFLITSLIIVALYIILILLGVPVNWVYLLAALCLFSFVREAVKMEIHYFPMLKITRHEEVCIDCNLCTKACPQAIDVAKVKWTVKHIDCNMCSDCIAKCPAEGALKINKRKIYRFPALIIIVLLAAGLFIGSTFELPTVNVRWGTGEEIDRAAVYEQSGIKNVKCFGSSMSFVEQMKKVKGVLGVETFTGSRSVKIFFDPAILDTAKVKKAIFTPVKYMLNYPDSLTTTVKYFRFGIDRFFDKYDSFYLTRLLENQKGIFGFTTDFGEPVIVCVYYDDKVFNPDYLKPIVESRSVTYEADNQMYTEPVNFRYIPLGYEKMDITISDLKNLMFEPYYDSFNHFEDYSQSEIKVYVIEMPQAADPLLKRWLPYLESHISKDTGIIAFETVLPADVPFANIYFVEKITYPEKIFASLSKDSLLITYRNGEKEKVKNPYHFIKGGMIMKPE